jgi:hypothetical protein
MSSDQSLRIRIVLAPWKEWFSGMAISVERHWKISFNQSVMTQTFKSAKQIQWIQSSRSEWSAPWNRTGAFCWESFDPKSMVLREKVAAYHRLDLTGNRGKSDGSQFSQETGQGISKIPFHHTFQIRSWDKSFVMLTVMEMTTACSLFSEVQAEVRSRNPWSTVSNLSSQFADAFDDWIYGSVRSWKGNLKRVMTERRCRIGCVFDRVLLDLDPAKAIPARKFKIFGWPFCAALAYSDEKK